MSTQSMLAHDHISKQGTLAHKNVSMQGTLTCEHLSKQVTLEYEHVRQVRQFSRLHYFSSCCCELLKTSKEGTEMC